MNLVVEGKIDVDIVDLASTKIGDQVQFIGEELSPFIEALLIQKNRKSLRGGILEVKMAYRNWKTPIEVHET